MTKIGEKIWEKEFEGLEIRQDGGNLLVYSEQNPHPVVLELSDIPGIVRSTKNPEEHDFTAFEVKDLDE